jgi:hypothetical protein
MDFLMQMMMRAEIFVTSISKTIPNKGLFQFPNMKGKMVSMHPSIFNLLKKGAKSGEKESNL